MQTLYKLCRKQIRRYLLSPAGAGGNYNNLFMVIPKMPLPRIVKDFLLYNIDIHELIWQEEYVARVSVSELRSIARRDYDIEE